MKINQSELNKSISEDNNFSEYKSFKAEIYFPIERHDFAKEFKVDESFESKVNSEKILKKLSNKLKRFLMLHKILVNRLLQNLQLF